MLTPVYKKPSNLKAQALWWILTPGEGGLRDIHYQMRLTYYYTGLRVNEEIDLYDKSAAYELLVKLTELGERPASAKLTAYCTETGLLDTTSTMDLFAAELLPLEEVVVAEVVLPDKEVLRQEPEHVTPASESPYPSLLMATLAIFGFIAILLWGAVAYAH